MRTLSIRLNFLRACSAIASVFPIFQMFILYTLSIRVRTDAFTEHTRQELLRAMSIRIKNWCVRWAYASGTDASTEHTRQKLMRALSIRIKNWCVHWAYASGTASILLYQFHINTYWEERRKILYNTAFDFLSGIIQHARHRRGSLCSHHIGNLSGTQSVFFLVRLVIFHHLS